MSDRPAEGAGASWAAAFAETRVLAGLSLEELARRCGVSATTVRKWEHGETLPSELNWPALQRVLPQLPDPRRSAVVETVTAPAPAPAAPAEPEAVPAALRVATPLETSEPAGAPAQEPTYEELKAEVRRLSELSTIDPLTGVPNKRAVSAALERTIRAAHRRGEPLAVLALDVDHFKKLNDTHGHPVGDEVLKAVAAALSGGVREHDVFGRVGGEEFLAVLEAVPAQRARVLAERMRGRVESLNVEGIRCTVSIGVSVHSAPRRPLKDDEAEQLARQLVERADKALYWAKQDGRNRVALWSADAEEQRAAAARRAELAQAATAMLSPTRQPSRWTLRRLGYAAAALGLFFSTASLGSEGGCSGGPPVTCGPGTCNDNGKCIPCRPADGTEVDK